jgi:hypothetical protein
VGALAAGYLIMIIVTGMILWSTGASRAAVGTAVTARRRAVGAVVVPAIPAGEEAV